MLEINTKTELEDYTRYLFTNKKAILIYIIYIIIISYVLTLFSLNIITSPSIIAFVWLACAVATAIMYREVKSTYVTEKEYRTIVKYTIDEKGVIIESGDFDRNKYEYKDIYDVEETSKYYAIYVSIRRFYLIDKKQLNESEHIYFRELITKNLRADKYKITKMQ